MSYKTTRILLVFLLVFAAFSPPFACAKEPSLRVTFLDVGQGDSIMLRSADKTILIDAGDDRFDVGKRVLIPFCKKEGIKKIDYCVISHPHRDHFAGFIDLIDAIPVGEFLYSTDTMGSNDEEEGGSDYQLYMRLYNSIKEKKIKYTQVKMGDTLNFGTGLKVDLLHAAEGRFAERNLEPMLIELEKTTDGVPAKVSANEDSLIFRVTAGKVSYLFSGDAEFEAESYAVKNFPKKLKCTVMKAGHHGSKTSSTLPYMDLAKPEYTVIQVGEKNSFKHPSPETLEKYDYYKTKVFRTDKDGTVDSITDGQTVRFISNQSPLDFEAKPKVVSLTPNSVTVHWKTNKPSDTQLKFGTTSLSQSKKIDHAVTDHIITLSGLTAGTAYKFQAISVDERYADQIVTHDGAFTTPTGTSEGATIESLTVNDSEIYMNKSFVLKAALKNSVSKSSTGLTAELYHSAMNPDTLIKKVSGLAIEGDGSLAVDFPVEINWLGKVELILVLKKGANILDTASLNLEVLPKLMVVDCSHGNVDYYQGKFSGMRIDLNKHLGFEMTSTSKGITPQILKNVFILVIPEPITEFTDPEIAAIKQFLSKGGSVMMFCRCDYANWSNPQILNKLLAGLNSEIRFNDDEFCDPTNNTSAVWRVLMHVFPSPVISKVKQILVLTPCSLINKANSGLKASKSVHLFATGDDDCYNLDADGLGDAYFYASASPKLPIPVIAGEDLGLGRIACYGDPLYGERLYAPNATMQVPEFNRCVAKWLSAAKERTLEDLLAYFETIPEMTDPEAAAIRYEDLKKVVMETVESAIERNAGDDVIQTFSQFKGEAVSNLRKEIRSTIKFKQIHGELKAKQSSLENF